MILSGDEQDFHFGQLDILVSHKIFFGIFGSVFWPDLGILVTSSSVFFFFLGGPKGPQCGHKEKK